MDRHRDPYEKKEKIARAKILPKGIYGCELAPISEAGMRTFRSAVAYCLTYFTKRRSVDLTSAKATRGTDVDPDVAVVCRRTTVLRRALTMNDGNAKTIEDIIEKYAEKKVPRIYRNEDELKWTQIAREPATTRRMACEKSANHTATSETFLNQSIFKEPFWTEPSG